MARLKQAADPEKEAEIRRLLEQFKQGFVGDLADLERAKRKFSSSFVEAVIAQFESIIPECVLGMKAVDFLAEMEKDEDEASDTVRTTITKGKEKPQQFVSVMTPAGVKVKIPPFIRTRVTGTVLEPRPSRFEEVLFSVHGTPVLGAGNDVSNDRDSKVAKKTRMITKFLQQQSESEMSPATRKIVQQLTSVLLSKASKQETQV